MPKTSYAEKINDVKVMASGLTKNLTRLTRRGIDDLFIQSIATLNQEAVGLNNEQESLKEKNSPGSLSTVHCKHFFSAFDNVILV